MGFDPISLTALAVGAAGAGLSADAAYQKGQATGAAADYQSQVAANNSLIAEENESETAASGAAKEAALGMRTRAAVGETTATQGASGIDVNSGSAPAVRSSEQELGKLDALTIRSNTAREAYGYAVKSESDTAQSQLDTFEGAQARAGGDVSALGTFLNGASSVGGKFANLQLRNGTPSVSPEEI
jgi:hypothetical protein